MNINQLNQTQEIQLIRSFNLFGAITDKTAESFMDFVGQIIHQEDTNIQNSNSIGQKYTSQPITLYINTPGGSVTAGSSIIDGINVLQSLGIEVIGVGTGSVMSMGIPILIACNVRKGMEFTEYMIHGVSCGSYDYVSKSMRYFEFVKKMEDRLNKFMIKRTNITQELFDKYQEDEFFFDTETAIELGIINHVDEKPEPTEDDLAIEALRSMTKQELKSYISKTQDVFEAKLEAELKKKKTDIFLVNAFESTINSCEVFMGLVDEINTCNEIDDIYALTIYDLISPAMIEGDSDEE